jgi:hypothetical protein
MMQIYITKVMQNKFHLIVSGPQPKFITPHPPLALHQPRPAIGDKSTSAIPTDTDELRCASTPSHWYS